MNERMNAKVLLYLYHSYVP